MIDFPLLYICLKSTAVTPVNTICTVKKGHSQKKSKLKEILNQTLMIKRQ